jgi:hypothetical protein
MTIDLVVHQSTDEELFRVLRESGIVLLQCDGVALVVQVVRIVEPALTPDAQAYALERFGVECQSM